MGGDHPPDARGRPSSGTHRKRQSTGRRRGGPARSSDEGPVMGLEPREPGRSGHPEVNPQGKEPTDGPKLKVKSFEIPKRLIAEAWERVRANDGAPGVDAASIAEFERYPDIGITFVMPTAPLCRLRTSFPVAVSGSRFRSRHNHSPSRKASRASVGR